MPRIQKTVPNADAEELGLQFEEPLQVFPRVNEADQKEERL
jgi:hypothetical protein